MTEILSQDENVEQKKTSFNLFAMNGRFMSVLMKVFPLFVGGILGISIGVIDKIMTVDDLKTDTLPLI